MEVRVKLEYYDILESNGREIFKEESVVRDVIQSTLVILSGVHLIE